MYLFTRRVLVNPAHIRAGMAHAISMAEYVNQKTELDVSLFQVLQGEPQGTLSFAYRTESFAASLESIDELLGSDEYLAKVEEGAAWFIGNPEDRLGRIVHISGEVEGAPAAATIVTANIDVPKVQQALVWSIEIADYTANLGGAPVAVVTSNFGEFGTISWITYGQSVAQLEQAQEKTDGDPGYLQRLADSDGLFIPTSGSGSLARRIA